MFFKSTERTTVHNSGRQAGRTIVKSFHPCGRPFLFQRLIHSLLDAGTDIQTGQFVVPHLRENAVGKKDVDQVIVRVYPSTSACKTCMSVDRCRSLLTTRTPTRIAAIGLVEAKTTAAGTGQCGGKDTTSLRTEVTTAVQFTPVQQHLIERRPFSSPPFNSI